MLLIENVGNLICPTSYDLGEDFKVALLSVTEGDDKPFKYPAIFSRAGITVITKVDLLPHVEFDLAAVRRAGPRAQPDGPPARHVCPQRRRDGGVVRPAGGAPPSEAVGARLSAAADVRFRITCRGVVQGVGFRPAVFRLANALRLGGWVCNTPDGVVVEVEGAEEAVGRFIVGLQVALPPLARLTDLEVGAVPALAESRFRVLASAAGRRQRALVPPDTALCAGCRADMDDPGNRRHAYPFTTCTDCGPRFSIVRGLPYDRERTAMACFPSVRFLRARVHGPRRPSLPRRAGVLPGVRPPAVAAGRAGDGGRLRRRGACRGAADSSPPGRSSR